MAAGQHADHPALGIERHDGGVEPGGQALGEGERARREGDVEIHARAAAQPVAHGAAHEDGIRRPGRSRAPPRAAAGRRTGSAGRDGRRPCYPRPGPQTVRYFDAHVHLHPPRLAAAIEQWFARENWHTAHPFEPAAVAETLSARGVERFCFFTYAHKPGMARDLNQWVAETAARHPQAVALGTLHVDDPDLEATAARRHRGLGLRGFKFHCSVQRFPVDDARLFPVYERAEAEGLCFTLHVGTMPYRDPFTGLRGFARVMARFPRLRVCVAHMGAFDTDGFLALTERYPHLYLDTTMAMTAAGHALSWASTPPPSPTRPSCTIKIGSCSARTFP